MELLADWRSPHFEQELARLDRGGVTFEFLRRNRRYRQEYAAALARIASGSADKGETIERLSSRWGLVFPGRPLCIRLDSATLMVAEALSGHGHRHDCARRIRGRPVDRPGAAGRRRQAD